MSQPWLHAAVGGGLALGLATAFVPGPAEVQQKWAVLVMAVSRGLGFWPTSAGGNRGLWGLFAYLTKVGFATAAVIRSSWNEETRAAIALWQKPPTSPLLKRLPFLILISHGACDWVQLRRAVPCRTLLLMNAYTALISTVAPWLQQEDHTVLAYIRICFPLCIWTVLAPWLLLDVLPGAFAWARKQRAHAKQPASQACAEEAAAAATAAAAAPTKSQQPGLHKRHAHTTTPSTTCEAVAGASSSMGLGGCSAGAQLCQSAAVSLCKPKPPPVYQSCLGPELRMAAKLYVDQHPSDLAADVASAMQTALLDCGLCVTQFAARTGCIAISLDARRAGPPATPRSSTDPSSQETDLQQAALRLLSVLQPVLDHATATRPGQRLVTFQMDHTLVTARWDATEAAWKLGMSEQLAPEGPQFSLGVLRQLPAPAAAAARQAREASTAAGRDAPAGHADAATRVSCNGTSSSSDAGNAAAPGMHTVYVWAQLVSHAGSPPISPSQLASMEGWEAGSQQGTGHEAEQPDRCRLLARAGTSFVSTAVLEACEPNTRCPHASVKLELRVPDWLLPRHHAGGPAVGLLPLVLELWQGPRLASSGTLLLRAPAASAASAACWWWGASNSSVQQGMRDLQQATEARWAEGASSQEEWRVVQSDLAVWLEHVQHVAVLCGQCTACPAGPASQWQLAPPARALTRAKLQQLGLALEQFAGARALQGLAGMVRQQQAVLRAWDGQPTASAVGSSSRRSSSGGGASVAARAAWQAVWGAPCAQCEASYRADMAARLSPLQFIASCGLGSAGLLRSAHAVSVQDRWPVLILLPYAQLHLLLAAHQLLTRPGVAAAQQLPHKPRRWPVPETTQQAIVVWLRLLVLVWRMLVHGVVAAGLAPIQLDKGVGPMLLIYIWHVLADQVSMTPQLGARMALGIALLDASLFAAMLHGLALLHWAWVPALALLMCLPRLALEAGVRGMLIQAQHKPLPAAVRKHTLA